jgi:hypothetical protein
VEAIITALDGRVSVLPGRQAGLYRLVVSDTPGSELIIASPYLISDLTRTCLGEEIDEFEHLINDVATSERQLQRFFEAHPKFLLGRQYQSLHAQIVLERDQRGPLIPDFVLQPFDRSFCDIVDLKLPREPVVVGSENRKRFSAAIYEASAQLRKYRDYFDDEGNRMSVKKRYGVTAYRPRLAVIIGRAARCDETLYRQIQDGVKDIDIVTYDDLVRRAKRCRLI